MTQEQLDKANELREAMVVAQSRLEELDGIYSGGFFRLDVAYGNELKALMSFYSSPADGGTVADRCMAILRDSLVAEMQRTAAEFAAYLESPAQAGLGGQVLPTEYKGIKRHGEA